METFSISTLDLIIVFAYMVFIVWWGLKNGKSQDSQSYFLAGRSMPWWVVGLSLFAASISSTTLIGQSGDAYHTGLAVFNYNLTGIIVMVFFAIFLLPLYIKSGIFTIPEFLENVLTDVHAITFRASASSETSSWMQLVHYMQLH